MVLYIFPRRDYSLSGDYRHVFVKPEQTSWSIHRYDDVTKSLVLSDLEKLKGEILEEPASGKRFSRRRHHEAFWMLIFFNAKISQSVTVVTSLVVF